MSSITKLIGYERNVGSFTDKATGEKISYSNRILRAVTNAGASKDSVGFASFEEKLKLSELVSFFNIPTKDSNGKDISDLNEAVDNRLNLLIDKNIEFIRAPRKGEFVVVGISVK